MADVSALEARTEGWVSGLQLAALSMQQQGDNADFISSFTGSHRYIIDYLTDEALNRQPRPVQQFLLQTSVLNRLCAPLCDAVSENSESRSPLTPSQQMLDYLEQKNLFLISGAGIATTICLPLRCATGCNSNPTLRYWLTCTRAPTCGLSKMPCPPTRWNG